MAMTESSVLPTPKLPSKAEQALQLVNADADLDRRLITLLGMADIAKSGMGSFPQVHPAPSEELLGKLYALGIIKYEHVMDQRKVYAFTGDVQDKEAVTRWSALVKRPQ